MMPSPHRTNWRRRSWDKWKNVNVNAIVDPDYAHHVRLIGHSDQGSRSTACS